VKSCLFYVGLLRHTATEVCRARRTNVNKPQSLAIIFILTALLPSTGDLVPPHTFDSTFSYCNHRSNKLTIIIIE